MRVKELTCHRSAIMSPEIRELEKQIARNESRIRYLMQTPDHVCPPEPWNTRYLMPGGAPELDVRRRLNETYQSEIRRLVSL